MPHEHAPGKTRSDNSRAMANQTAANGISRPSISPFVIQPKVSVVNPPANDNTHPVQLQIQVVRAAGGGSRFFNKPDLLNMVIAEVDRIVNASDTAQGVANPGVEYNRISGLLDDPGVKGTLPKDGRSTYGLGGSNYMGTAPFTSIQGPQNFATAIAAQSGGTTEELGNRSNKIHDEVHQITEYPGLQALKSTQGHCFFCYGLIHLRGYQHGPMRDKDPWPQNWKHDYMNFTLNQSSSNLDYVSTNPIIKIDTQNYGTRYYEVS